MATLALPNATPLLGPYTPGATYARNQVVTANGSSYYVTVAFTATTLSADLAAGRLVVNAARGRPAVNWRGPYLASATYSVGDGVTVASTTRGAPTAWSMVASAAAGNAPAAGSAYWGIVATGSPIDSGLVSDATYGLLPAALLTLTKAAAAAEADAQTGVKAAAAAEKDAQAGIAAAAANAALLTKVIADLGTINAALASAKVSGFPVTLTSASGNSSSSSTTTSSSSTTTSSSGGTSSSSSSGTAWTGPSGAAAASNGSAYDSTTAANKTVYSQPQEMSY